MMESVCFAGHSFLKRERVEGAFSAGDPLLVSRGGLTYRELLDTKRGRDFAVEVADCMQKQGCTTLVVVLGDNDFSRLVGGSIEKSEYYDEMLARPKAVVQEWRHKALTLARRSGATHVVMTPVFPRYFVKKAGDAAIKRPRRKRRRLAVHPDLEELPWCIDTGNWHNEMAKQVNRQLRGVVGVKWRRYVVDGTAINMSLLDVNPLSVVQPNQYTEWETRESRVRCCVHPTASAFADFYVEPLMRLLQSLN